MFFSKIGSIHNGLSDDQGLLEGQAVAVKKLKEEYIDDKTFSREVRCLTKLKPHNNIVRFLGYYSGAEQMCVPYEGTSVIADHTRHRLLCFEYQPDSLDRRMSGKIICNRITLHMIPIVSRIKPLFYPLLNRCIVWTWLDSALPNNLGETSYGLANS